MLRTIPIILVLVLSVGFADGQTKRYKTCRANQPGPKLAKKVAKKSIKTVSLGVINGKAIDLVKPDYPKAALAVNAYGQVMVRVLVDETGKVISTSVLKGHPLLRSTATIAALKATFEPVRLGGVPVRVDGIISYNFLPQQWNWLEIGFIVGYGSSYYSTENLEHELPGGFDEVSRFLNQSRESSANWDNTVETVVALIRSELSTDRKAAWLFEVGLKIAKADSSCCRIEDEMRTLIQDVGVLIESRPPDSAPILALRLRRLVFLIENPSSETYDPIDGSSIYQLLTRMKEEFPFVGR